MHIQLVPAAPDGRDERYKRPIEAIGCSGMPRVRAACAP